MSKLSNNHLWEWFKKYNSEYLHFTKKSKKETTYWLNELTVHLKAYNKFFDFSLSNSKDGKSGTLTISVDGKGNHFKKVDAIVAKAPILPEWTFKALEDPFPIDFMCDTEIAKTGVDPRELVFQPNNDSHPLVISVFHPLWTEEKEHEFYNLARNAVYNILGERSFGTDIRRMDVENLSFACEADELYNLEILPEYIGSLKSSVMVDGNGVLFDMKK